MVQAPTTTQSASRRSAASASSSVARGAAQESLLFVSYQDVFEHLELARHQRDLRQIRAILACRMDEFKSCLQPFPIGAGARFGDSNADLPPHTLTLADASTHTLDHNTRKLCNAVVEQYHVSQPLAFRLLTTFFASEHADVQRVQQVVTSYLDAAPHSVGRSRGATQNHHRLRALYPNSSTVTVASEEDVLDAFNIFYFEERMYLLRTIGSLIRITEDSQHRYFDLANSLLDVFADQAFAQQCIHHFCSLVELALPESIRHQPRYSSLWAKQILREQFGLLEIVFLLFYGRLSPCPDSLLALLSAVQHTHVGRRQANVGFLDAEATQTVECIGHLLVLISVELLSLEQVMDGFDLLQPSQTHISNHPASLEHALDLLSNTSADALQAPILLAWALVLHRVEHALVAYFDACELDTSREVSAHVSQLAKVVTIEDGGVALSRRLAQAAFAPQLGLFDTLMSLLASPLLTSSNGASSPAVAGPSALAYRAVFKGVLLSITEIVKPEFLPNFNALVGLWQATFGSGLSLQLSQSAIDGVAALCDQFWQVDSRYESRCTTLDTARRRWPVSFRPLILLTNALSGHASVDAHACWPSLLHRRSHPRAEERASAAVFDYLANVPTFAQVLPMGANTPNAPFETMEGGDYTSVTYRLTRLMHIPGTQIRLPPGTIGSTISELGKQPVIVLWSPARPVSAWKLMRDILSSFPPIYAEHRGLHAEADPFHDHKHMVSFAQLSPADSDEPWEELASDMLELFASIICASVDLAWSLLAHLDGRDINADELSLDFEPEELEHIQTEKEELANANSLASIVVNLLSHALVGGRINVRLVRSALRLLTVLLPYDPEAVWQEVRSSNVLIGCAGAVPYLDKSVGGGVRLFTSTLLVHEMGRASYDGLVSLLDFHIGLFFELRRSYSTSSIDVLETKTSVLLRTFRWIFESVWCEYQNWRYTRLADRLEIGTKCIRLLEMALHKPNWRSSHPSELVAPATALVEAAEQSLVIHPSIVGLAPLITCIGTGQQLLDALGRAGRHTEATLAEDWIDSTLRLATLLVGRKREITIGVMRDLSTLPVETAKKAMSARINMGLFERLFFDHTIVASRASFSAGRTSNRVELASATFNYVLFPTSTSISSSAAHLITAVLRSVADLVSTGKQPPALIGHLGTLDQIEQTLSGLVQLVANPNQHTALKVQVWTMLAAIVDTQPAFATLLLTGRHLAMCTETTLHNNQTDSNHDACDATQSVSGMEANDSVNAHPLAKTALDVGSEAVLSWRTTYTHNPELLEAVLRFLDIAWVHAPEHVAAFDTIRTNSTFFRALAHVICETSLVPSTRADAFVDAHATLRSSNHAGVATYCYRKLCQARSLRLLQHDIQLGGILKHRLKSSVSSKASVQALFEILVSSDRTLDAIEQCFCMACDPVVRTLLECKLAQLFPTIPLDSLRHPTRKDDFDLDRRYGDNYHINVDCFRNQAEQRFWDANVERGDTTLLDEALLALYSINMEWSVIDVHNSVLQAWTQCIQVCMGRIVTQAIHQDKMFAFEQSMLTTWMRLATLAADEGRQAEFMHGVHATRLSLLTKCFELACGSRRTTDVSSLDHIVQAATLCARLLTHPFFRVEDSLASSGSMQFHRDVLEMVLVCVARIRALVSTKREALRLDESLVECQKALNASVDLFCRHAVEALRIKIECALRIVPKVQRHESEVQCLEDDLDILVSIFEMSIRHDVGVDTTVWLSHIQDTQLVHVTINLVGRAPILRPDSVNGINTRVNPNSTHHVAFLKPLLALLLAVASQPSSSEQLALQGAVNALASNMLTDSLEDGRISALLLSGDANPSHECWRMMLRIVVNLIDNLANLGNAEGGGSNWRGVSARFVETDVYGFIRVYQKQIDKAMDLNPLQTTLDSMAGMLAPSQPTFSNANSSLADGVGMCLEQLDELELISRLFYSLTRMDSDPPHQVSTSRTEGETVGTTIVQHFAQKCSWTLQPLVYLLQHPNELASLLGLDSTHEATKMELEIGMDKIRSIVSILIASLWNHTRCALVLCHDTPSWPTSASGCAVIQPTTRTASTRRASIGTLLDLSSHLTDYLRKSNVEGDGGRRGGCSATLEQVLGLVVCQVAIWALGRGKDGGERGRLEEVARRELEAGLGRDVGEAVSEAKEVVGGGGGLLELVMTFVESKLSGSLF